MKNTFKLLIVIFVIVILTIAGLIAFAFITDYNPQQLENAVIINNNNPILIDKSKPLKIMTYNIGYGGLDKEQDFFLEGGKGSGASTQNKVETNLKAFIETIEAEDADIIALQEVDVKSKRSFNINQVEQISGFFKNTYNSYFANNFIVKFIPMPWLAPTGNVDSGILTLSKAKSVSNTRVDLPSEFPFIEKYFMLDRCFIESIYEIDDEKELIFLNVHLSAYDKGGSLKYQQIEFLANYLKDVAKDNDKYIIIAGDFNMVLDSEYFSKHEEPLPSWVTEISKALNDIGLRPAYDLGVTTTRSNEQPYIEGENFETVIDGFFISNNLEVVEVKGLDLSYENSDHNPVILTVKFK